MGGGGRRMEREDIANQDNENSNREIKDEFSLSWLVVFCLLSPYLTINPGKRYEEVDGVRKEKERLTTDHQPKPPEDIFWLIGR